MSCFTNPKIAEIDEALTELEPNMVEFTHSHGFVLARSIEGSFNVPHRRLHRDSEGIRHEIGLIIDAPMPERLERGFYPDIPCAMYITAVDLVTQRYHHSTITEAQPYTLLRDSLRRHLVDALAVLEPCSADFISRYGVSQ